MYVRVYMKQKDISFISRSSGGVGGVCGSYSIEWKDFLLPYTTQHTIYIVCLFVAIGIYQAGWEGIQCRVSVSSCPYP